MRKLLTVFVVSAFLSLPFNICAQKEIGEATPYGAKCYVCNKGWSHEIGRYVRDATPIEQDCAHGYPYGTDILRRKATTITYKCDYCSHVREGTYYTVIKTECHGYN